VELRQPPAPAIRLGMSPCPFCGALPEAIAELRRFEGMQARTLHQVICRCGAAGPERSSARAAAEAWAGPPSQPRAIASQAASAEPLSAAG
jgi:hypothetical protein